MFFELADLSLDSTTHMSWLIGKNPEGVPFSRSISASDEAFRSVVGVYSGPNAYRVSIENDELAWMLHLREENRAHYVSAAPYIVSPKNLKGILVALKSAIDGKNPSKGQISDEEIRRPRKWHAVLGPFVCPDGPIMEVYGGFGLELGILRGEYEGRLTSAANIAFQATSSLAEFLQKILVGAYALSIVRHDERHLQDSLIDSLMRASEGWIGQTPSAAKVIRQITRGKSEKAKEWGEKVQEEGAPPIIAHEEKKERVTLHDRRHQIIRELVQPGAQVLDSYRIVDLGAGDGKLTAKLLSDFEHARVLAIDADPKNLEYLTRRIESAFPGREERQKVKARFEKRRDNIAAPYLESFDRDPDCVILSEVVEHLHREDRERLIESLGYLWRATHIIITTPNVDYNPVIGLAPGEYRHADHKIEYDWNTLNREVIAPLRKLGYVVRLRPMLTHEDIGGDFGIVSSLPSNDQWFHHSIVPGYTLDATPGFEYITQPSWIIDARRSHDAPTNDIGIYHARAAHAPLHLYETGYTVSLKEMIEGMTSETYRSHRNGLAYLAPTIAPVEWDQQAPDFLEHPSSAFKYFQERGVVDLVGEKKYMGSRMTLVAFRNPDLAATFGYSKGLIYAWSRQGYPFFKEDDDTLKKLHAILALAGFFDDDDMVVLDGEWLPWSFKAGKDRGLIQTAFRDPGEVAYLDAVFKGDVARREAAEKFLKVLDIHAEAMPPTFVPFDCLLRGTVTKKGMKNVRHSCFTPRTSMLNWLWTRIESLTHVDPEILAAGPKLQACEWHPILLEKAIPASPEVTQYYTRVWQQHCDAGAEGFVYKPDDRSHLPDGAFVQSALKVRGKEYLRLIYGMNYDDPKFFARLKERKISGKRRLAMQEGLLADRILRSFMRQEYAERDQYVAAFLGTDGHGGRSIDATL